MREEEWHQCFEAGLLGALKVNGRYQQLLRPDPKGTDAFLPNDSLIGYIKRSSTRDKWPILPEVWDALLALPKANFATIGFWWAFMYGCPDRGELLLRKGLELGEPLAGFPLGFLLEKQNRFDEAEAAYQRGIELGHVDSALGLGNLFRKRGRFKEAEAAYQRGVELGDGRAADNLGTLLMEQHRLQEAIAAFQKGLELGEGAAGCSLGLLLEKQNRFDEAEATYQRGLELGAV
jgi:tetratricopeptide (TPR) repeat protein